MKPSRYPLAAALEQRRALKKEKACALAEALAVVEHATEAVRLAEQARVRLTDDRETRAAHLYDPDPAGLLSLPLVERRTDEVKNLDGRILEAGRRVESAQQARSRAEATVETARADLAHADRELRAVEKHHEAWLAEQRKEATRKEQRQADEVVLARHAAELGERGHE